MEEGRRGDWSLRGHGRNMKREDGEKKGTSGGRSGGQVVEEEEKEKRIKRKGEGEGRYIGRGCKPTVRPGSNGRTDPLTFYV